MKPPTIRALCMLFVIGLMILVPAATQGGSIGADVSRLLQTPPHLPAPTRTDSLKAASLISGPINETQRASRVIRVPTDYPTITQALAVAVSGDIVQVDSGTYNEGALGVPSGVSLIGNGWQNTIVNGNGANVVVYANPGTTIRGMTIRGSSSGYFDTGIWTSSGASTIADNRITGNSAGVWAWCFDPSTCNIRVTLENNIVDANTSNGINSNEYAIFTLRNNTVVRNGAAGVILNNVGSMAENNIVASNTGDGLVNNAGANVRYNDVWGQTRNYVGGSVGEGGISGNPLFRDAASGDYRLYAGSPAVDSGVPSGVDMGALPFTPVDLPPVSVTLIQLDDTTWQVDWTSTGAPGYRLYYGSCTRLDTVIVPVGGALSYRITNTSADEVSYVAVSASNAGLQESSVRLANGIKAPCPSAPVQLEAGAFPDRQIRLQWQDTASNEDGYRVERAVGTPNSTAHGPYSQAGVLPANTTVFTDSLSVLGETYWYRIRAYNANGNSPYSNETYNATFDVVPVHDEQYLLVLINEARAAPGAFGYPSIAPVPPVAYSPLLNYAAHSHSQAILNSGFQIGHCDPIGRCPTERAHAVGYIGGVGENLIQGMTGPGWVESSNQAFMNSEGHRNNMLCACFTEAGLGHTYDVDKGGTSYWKGQYTETFSSRSGVVIPNLPSGVVIPYSGTSETDFTFIVNYYHASGNPPTQAFVYIDDAPHTLSLSTGGAANGTYRFNRRLAPGTHTYYFSFTFSGGSARLPASGDYNVSVAGPNTPTATPTRTATPTPTSTRSVPLPVRAYLPLILH